MPRKVDSSTPPRPSKTQKSADSKPAVATPAPQDASTHWLAQTKPSDPGAPDKFHTARIMRVTKEGGQLANDFTKLQNAVAGGMHADFVTGAGAIAKLKGVSAAQSKLLFDAAKEVAGRKAAMEVMTSWGATVAKMQPSAAERALAMTKVTQKALGDGAFAAKAYLSKFTDAATAEKLAKNISNSKMATEYITNATKAGSFMKWVGVAAHGLTGAMLGYDAYKAVQTQRDPNASTGQKIAGWVTAAADAAMFVPFPPLQILGAVASVGGALFRDSKHPLKDAGDWIAEKGRAIGTLASTEPSPAPAQ